MRGKSLSQLINERGKIKEEEALEIIKKVCEALSIVHKEGYLHRDIKPDNIFLTEEGRVVLIDFGSAREFIAGKTKTHTVILTPGYAPLEQYSQVAERGPYTDIYALSATLYHMLTGQAPIDAPARQAGMKLPSPREVNPSISEAVSRAVMAGLEMDYRKRPQSVEDFLSLLKPRETPYMITVSQTSSLTKPFILLTSLIHMYPVLSVAFSPDGNFLATGSWASVNIWRLADDILIRMLNHNDWVLSLAFSQDAKLLASGSRDKTIKIWRFSDGKQLLMLRERGPILSLAFSPDGSLLATGSIGAVNLWRISDGRLLQTLDEKANCYSVAFSPNGELLASASTDGTVKIWRVKGGSLLKTLGHRVAVFAVAFSPNGELLASGSEDRGVNVWRMKDGKLIWKSRGHRRRVISIAFSPDGNFLASGSWGTVKIWNANDGKL
ncbi:MAG: protein kinase domain-containing protein, partial [bacterium]